MDVIRSNKPSRGHGLNQMSCTLPGDYYIFVWKMKGTDVPSLYMPLRYMVGVCKGYDADRAKSKQRDENLRGIPEEK